MSSLAELKVKFVAAIGYGKLAIAHEMLALAVAPSVGNLQQRQLQAVIDRYKNTSQWLKSPNGKPTNLNWWQWAVVRTPSFKEWFGDWEVADQQPAPLVELTGDEIPEQTKQESSKLDNKKYLSSEAIDENGEPMVFYHGTNADFDTFDPSAIRKEGRRTSASIGISLAFSKEFADDYGRKEDGGNVMPLFASVKKMWRPDNAGIANIRAAYEMKYHEPMPHFMDDYVKEGWWSVIEEFIPQLVKNFGYDGFLIKERGESNLFVLDANQIKSAIGNSGSFSTQSFSILDSATMPNFTIDELKSQFKIATGYGKIAVAKKMMGIDKTSFIPTHYLSDGTPAIHLDGNVYIDERGDENEDDYATPVDNVVINSPQEVSYETKEKPQEKNLKLKLWEHPKTGEKRVYINDSILDRRNDEKAYFYALSSGYPAIKVTSSVGLSSYQDSLIQGYIAENMDIPDSFEEVVKMAQAQNNVRINLDGIDDATIPNVNLEPNIQEAGNKKRSVQDAILADGGGNRRIARRAGAADGSARDRNSNNSGLPNDSPAAVRTGSDTGVGDGDWQYRPDAGTPDNTGSGELGDSGILVDRATNPAIEDAARRNAELTLKDKRVMQSDAELIDVVINDEANIRATLPFLLPEQQDDVAKIEKRFAEHHGMMITNGTGTGKTFTSLGTIKRFIKSGKSSILIVVPGDKIGQDFIDAAKNLHIGIKKLDGINDNGGEGVAVTTYANFYQNKSLLKRSWDLVVFDEAHKINSNQSGNMTEAQRMMRDVTLHPQAFASKVRAEINNEPRLKEISAALSQIKIEKNVSRQRLSSEDLLRLEGIQSELQIELEQIEAKIKEKWDSRRSKVLFLSATPFAYEKSIDYAEGYLFDYEKADGGAYNSGDGQQLFMMRHFGYTMRTNALTAPDARVNSGAMQRQFNEHLKKTGALSGRMLQVNADYSRQFIILKNRIGEQIDAGMEALSDERYRELKNYIWKANFSYLMRIKLLEAIKAKALVPRIQKHLALNRKVVLFHSFKVGGGFNPFVLEKSNTVWIDLEYSEKINIEEQYDAFNQQYPRFQNLKLDDLESPINTFKKAFGGKIAIYNGDIPKKQILKSAKNFNDDELDESIILMQVDKGKEGVSLHDTTGRKQRVLINLGLPVKPTDSIQTEGRIYRTGQVTNAIFEYISTGTDFEKRTFAEIIAERSGTAENLAMGNHARNLMAAFTEGYLNATDDDPSESQGTGGKHVNTSITGMSPFEKAVSDYFANQKANENTKAKGVDYFPTPEPLGLKMVELANIKPGEDALEPSAGHGAIARYFPETSNNTFVEPSGKLLGDLALRTAGNGETKQSTFEELSQHVKYNAIVMNPPFGHGGATAMFHLKKAMLHLKNGGRVVALIPDGGMAARSFDKLVEELPGNMYLMKTVLLPSVAFERAGTSVMTKIVVMQRFDKKTDAETAGSGIIVNLRQFNDINGMFEKLAVL